VPCSDCHKVGAAGRKDKILPFHFEDRTCTACHEDVHHGEFNERMARRRADGTPQGCEACHNVKSWADVNGFDHSKTKFPLLGAHRAAKCGDCHKVPAGKKEIQFKDTSQVCEDCHKDAHDGQFAKAGKTLCGDCHDCNAGRPPLSTTTPGRISPCRVAMQAWLATNAISRRAWSMPSL